MIINETFNNLINNPVRQIKGAVELYSSSALLDTYSYNGDLQEFTIERVGEGKFFGFGVSHKANVKVRDVDRTKTPKAGNELHFTFEGTNLFPSLYITEVHRDENTNQLSLTAYDALEKAAKTEYKTLQANPAYTLNELLLLINSSLGLSGIKKINIEEAPFTIEYQGNFEESDNLREVLNDVAEATQTIYYINQFNELVFKRLDKSGKAVYKIDKSKYITLKERDNKRLQTICKATELGDNVSISTELIGSTQYIRDNGFWELRDDIPKLLESAISAVGDLKIGQYEAEWRGNPLLEIGDKIELENKDSSALITFLLDDSLTYNGGLVQKSQWSYETEEDSSSNPSTIGDIINQTTARVDKQKQEIELLVKKSENTDKEVGALQNSVSTKIDSEQLQIEVKKEISKGVTNVTTSRGFTFNDEGLKITKTQAGQEEKLSTTINEDGMRVLDGSTVVLTASNQGVDAKNLHATTYLIIGSNSRFEDYNNDRTGCFYIREGVEF